MARPLEISQIYTLMGCFWPKYIMFEFRKYRGVMFNGTQDWNIVWRKNDVLPKITLRIWQIFTRAALENFKSGIFMVSFCLKLKMHKFKNYTGVCVMTMRNDAKLKSNWLFSSKLAKGIWQILTQALENIKNLHFNGMLFTKVYTFWAIKVQRGYIWWHWLMMQNLKENWLVLSKMTWRI